MDGGGVSSEGPQDTAQAVGVSAPPVHLPTRDPGPGAPGSPACRRCRPGTHLKNNLASIHAGSAFVGAVASSPTYQGPWEEFYPPMYQVMGRQTCVLSVDLAVAYELAPAPVSCSLGSPGEYLL